MFQKNKREDNANRQRSNNPLTTPWGGWSMNPLFSGPYLLNTWSREFSYHEIVTYDLHGRRHFNCAHACRFLHNVPTESDDVRIISCSLCRAISLLLCQKRFRRHQGLEAGTGFLSLDARVIWHCVWQIWEGKASSVPRNSCVERLEKSPVIFKSLQEKEKKAYHTFSLYSCKQVVFVLLHCFTVFHWKLWIKQITVTNARNAFV